MFIFLDPIVSYSSKDGQQNQINVLNKAIDIQIKIVNTACD